MNNAKPPFDTGTRLCFAPLQLRGLQQRGCAASWCNGGPNPNNLWGNPPDLQPYTFDLALARQHYAARAAAPPTGPSRSMCRTNQTDEAAQMFQADLRRVG